MDLACGCAWSSSGIGPGGLVGILGDMLWAMVSVFAPVLTGAFAVMLVTLAVVLGVRAWLARRATARAFEAWDASGDDEETALLQRRSERKKMRIKIIS